MNTWVAHSPDAVPPVGARVLVTDGATITIAHYTKSESHLNWFFDSPNFKDLKIEYWQYLPALPPKKIEIPLTKPIN